MPFAVARLECHGSRRGGDGAALAPYSRMSFGSVGRTARRALLAGAAIVALQSVLATGASCQTWNGTTNDYNDDSNWNPVGAPVSGLPAIFDSTGNSTVNVSGTVFPVDWTFTTNSQNYSVTGGEVGFRGGGIYNQGGANSISNDIIGFDILVTGGALVLGGSSVIFSSASVAASSSLTTTGNLLFYYGLTNDGTVNANGGAFNRAIFNNTGATFNVGGSVVGRGTFANASGATLAIRSGGSFTMTTPFSNAGIVTVASGGTLTATAGGINNAATGKITVAAGGTLRDDLNNAGIAINNGAYFATVASNTGTITNNASWTGNVTNTGGTVTLSLIHI